MRAKPRTRAQWAQLAVECAHTIQLHATDQDLKELAYAIEVLLISPAELRMKLFNSLDRLLDRVNGIEHETIAGKAIREFEERVAAKNRKYLQDLPAGAKP